MATAEQRSTASMPSPWCENNITMKACLWFSVVACVSMVLCALLGGLSPRWEEPVESDIWHAGVAILLVFSIAITELCIVVGGASNAYISDNVPVQEDDAPNLKLPGANYSWLTLLEYCAKIAVGVYTYTCSGGIMHTDTFALNGARPVYMARYAQWSFAVPVIVLITNSPFIESREMLIRRSWPSCFAAFSYVWASWLAIVTPHNSVRWLMMVYALAGDIFVTWDQLKVAGANRSTSCYNLKMGLLWYSKVINQLYTVVWLLGRFGIISSCTEHMIYPYSDATAKVLHGALLAMIRSREGANEISRWCAAAVAAGNDLKYLLREAKIPTLTIDLSGNIVQWNESVAQLTGLEVATVHGKSLLSLCEDSSKDYLSRALADKRQIFEGGASSIESESGLVELSIVTKLNQQNNMPPVRRLAMTLVPKRNAAGKLQGITAIGQDLSEIADLKMVEERKNALLAMLGHEIRSPLHGMMGLTCSLLENPESKPMHRQLGMVKGCTARLLDLVSNIMDLAQSEKKKMSGVAELRPTSEVDLPSIVEEAMVMIGCAVDKSNKPLLKPGVQLVNESIGAQVPLVRGDAYKCTQLLYNLMTNAAKFTDRGSISISFRHVPDARKLEIDVKDTGKGISEAGIKRIFLPFEQENSGDCRSYQGIGLGLAVCKQIADLHEGSLTVKSVVGQGSTFTFSLPCDDDMGAVEVKGDRVRTGSRTETKHFQRGQNMKLGTDVCSPIQAESALAYDFVSKSGSATKPLILSVDDDDVNQEVVKNTLSDFFEVKCTMSGQETLDYLDNVQKSKEPFPELMLLDIQMPGMTGFEVCERVRVHYGSEGASLPVMFLSAKAPVEQTAIQSFECGATDYVAKPFHPVLLRKKVAAVYNLKLSGVRLTGASVAASEACQRLRKYEMEATKAKERAVDLEAKLSESEVRAAQASDKAQYLELELVAVKETSDLQKTEVIKLSKKCDDMEVLVQGKNLLPLLPSTTGQSKTKCQVQISEHAASAALRRPKIYRCKVDSASDASLVINLLVSRLEVCSRSAKTCKDLLRGCFRPPAPGAAQAETAAPGPTDAETSCCQLSKFRRRTHVAVSKLAMLEDISSNLSGIMNMIGDEDVSTDLEALERQSSCSSQASTVSPAIASI